MSVNEQLREQATLGGGCFWCLEPVFEAVEGVESVVVGYAGGSTENPSYADIGRGNTGHAEVVQVTFDPASISFDEILEVFFGIHDPTTTDRQGADVGPQYRSIVLYHTPEQKETSESVIRRLEAEGVWGGLIVTEVRPFEVFYEAEEYHQDYYEKNPNAGYCLAVINPKMSHFRKHFAKRIKYSAAPAD
ncbi:MAG: peptide-methionine (S)-S-oxide reductase MsrA [Chloroflexi bacterium]|nr:peptide-methionine (S)-S-oxide reductase MsrA [Chloroflexota bacterium]